MNKHLVIVPLALLALGFGCAPAKPAAPAAAPAAQTAVPANTAPVPKHPDWKAYMTDEYSIYHPIDYAIEVPREKPPVLVVRGPLGRMELFHVRDFGGARPVAAGRDTSKMTPSEVDQSVPKERLQIGPSYATLDVWLYYASSDSNTKVLLKDMVNTIEVK